MRNPHVFRPPFAVLCLFCVLAVAVSSCTATRKLAPAQPYTKNDRELRQLCSTNVGRLLQQARAGDAEAQADLGKCCLEGWGVLKDERQTALLWRKAAEQGHARGTARLGSMYWAGKGGLPKDERRAVELYRKAAEQGHELAKGNLRRLGER